MQGVIEVLSQCDQYVHGALEPASQNDNCASPSYRVLQGCAQTTKDQQDPPGQRTSLFSEVKKPQMGQLGKKQGFG